MKTVCVLFGGVSTEHLISGRSAYNIITGLKKAKLNTICVGITKNGEFIRYNESLEYVKDGTWEEHLTQTVQTLTHEKGSIGFSVKDFLVTIIGEAPDVIFPAVHGINCEDGTLQGLLELSNIPYVGCGVLASAAGMDKVHAKRIFGAVKIPQCKYISVKRSDIEKDIEKVILKVENKLGYPCFLKPNNGGSSVGTQSAKNKDELVLALNEVSKYDRIILIEEFVPCREIEAAVMGNKKPKVSVLGEVLTATDIEYYDYKTKYFDADGATVCIPANLSDKVSASITRYAKKAYLALGCSGLSRVDFFIDKRNDKIYINEINTLPGFTPISLFPKAFEKSGVPLEMLLKKLCSYAIEEKRSKTRLEIL